MFGAGVCIVISVTLMKSYRLYKIFVNPNLKVVSIQNWHINVGSFVLTLFFIVICIAFVSIYPSKPINPYDNFCSSNESDILLACMSAYVLFLDFVGIYLSSLTPITSSIGLVVKTSRFCFISTPIFLLVKIIPLYYSNSLLVFPLTGLLSVVFNLIAIVGFCIVPLFHSSFNKNVDQEYLNLVSLSIKELTSKNRAIKSDISSAIVAIESKEARILEINQELAFRQLMDLIPSDYEIGNEAELDDEEEIGLQVTNSQES